MSEQDKERWTELVADFESSSLSQKEFSNERGISFSMLRYRIYRLRKKGRPLAPKDTEQVVSQVEERSARRRLTLKPVRVVASAAKKRPGVELIPFRGVSAASVVNDVPPENWTGNDFRISLG
jgi:hypothetical protein